MTKLFFSIIIPVYNDAEDLRLTLDSLEKQEFPRDLFEVIVVDNGSDDDSVTIAKEYSLNKVIVEEKYLGSPYSCRNRGVQIANGEHIIFLDSTCVPIINWLKEFRKAFLNKNADMVGGRVAFRFSDGMPTASEYFDSITNIRMKESIEGRGVAKTANLAVKKEVLEKVGLFEEGRRSGGDLLWTQKAVSKGFLLVYAEQAIVYKKARQFKELFKKQWRVSKAQPAIWIEAGRNISLPYLIFRFILVSGYSLIMFFVDLFINLFNRVIKFGKYKRACKNQIFGMAFIPNVIKLIMRVGNMVGYIKFKKQLSNT